MSLNRSAIVTACLLSGISTFNLAQASETPSNKHSKKASISNDEMLCAKDKMKCHNESRFQIGPYLNKDRLFDGSELLINIPTVREDARLLLNNYKLAKECAELGITLPKYPRLSISGKVEGLFAYTKPYVGKSTSDFTIDAAELDIYGQMTSWLSAYLAIDYDESKPSGKKVFMNRGFVTLGNLAVTPFYTSVGKMYVPFGRYASSMITAPMTLSLGRTRADTLVLGYQQTGDNALHAEGYVYEGITKYLTDKKRHHAEFGGDIGYEYKLGEVSGEVGVGAISNLADSASIHSTLFDTATALEVKRIPAIDTYGSLAYKKFNILAEYISALRTFNKANMAYAGRGAKPAALNVEVSYNFKTVGKPSSIAVGYASSSQAVAIGLPKRSYLVAYNINLIKNTNLAIEYRYDTNYSLSEGKGTNADTHQLGKSANTVSAQFDYFF